MNHQYRKLFSHGTTSQHKNRSSSNVKKSMISEATVLSWKLDCSVTVPDLFVFEVEKKFCWTKVSTLKGATWLLWVNDNLESHYCWSFIIHEQKHYYGSKVHRRHEGHHDHHYHHHHHHHHHHLRRHQQHQLAWFLAIRNQTLEKLTNATGVVSIHQNYQSKKGPAV